MLLLGLWIGPAAQAQTAYGPGGLFIHPTATVPSRGALDLNLSWYTQRIEGQPTTQWIPVSVAYSATDRFQVGPLFLERLVKDRSRASGGLFARYLLTPDGLHHPAVALAGNFYAGDVRLASVSLVSSHAFRQRDRSLFTVHLGAQWARRSDIPRAQDSLSGFVALEAPLSQNFAAVAEYGTRFSFDYKERSALGVVWRPKGGLQVGVGFVNTGRSSENGFFVGVGYPLGGNN
jgi:hypothetical protein